MSSQDLIVIFEINMQLTLWRKQMAQLSKCGLVRGHDKPIDGFVAIAIDPF